MEERYVLTPTSSKDLDEVKRTFFNDYNSLGRQSQRINDAYDKKEIKLQQAYDSAFQELLIAGGKSAAVTAALAVIAGPIIGKLGRMGGTGVKVAMHGVKKGFGA